MSALLLSVRGLSVQFRTPGGMVRAVDGIGFDLHPGESLAIVGESGSGKTAAALALLGLIPSPPALPPGGEAAFGGRDLLRLSEEEMRRVRGREIGMVFQDPLLSLNPFRRIEGQIMEVTRLHLGHGKAEARSHAAKMLAAVGIDPAHAASYPHQLSGGMRQRVTLAMALACGPKLLIADEATTALDATIQAQILDLLDDFRRTTGTAVILITHDLSVAAGSADRVLVMYAGRVMESAAAPRPFSAPHHPYTRALLRSIPDLTRGNERLYEIPSPPPGSTGIPQHQCAFAARCPEVMRRCREEEPPLRQIAEGHHSRCWVAA